MSYGGLALPGGLRIRGVPGSMVPPAKALQSEG